MRLIDAARLVAAVPPRAAGVAAALVSPVLTASAPRRRRTWLRNLRGAEIHGREGTLASRRPIYHHLLLLYESLAMIGGRRFPVRARGLEHLHEACRNGRGVLLVTAHVGNWTAGAQLVADLTGRPVHSVAGVQMFRGWTPSIRLALRRRGIRIHPRGRAVFRFVRVLRRGGIVGLHLDGDQHAAIGPATAGAALLARRTGARILPAVCLREAPGRFVAEFFPALAGGGDPPTPGEVEGILRGIVRSSPEQWSVFRPLWERG